jgi:hypothetical protein
MRRRFTAATDQFLSPATETPESEDGKIFGPIPGANTGGRESENHGKTGSLSLGGMW